MERIRIQYIDKIPKDKREGVYYYDLRAADIGMGYDIQERVLVNNIGSIASDTDLLNGKELITDEDFNELKTEEVFNLVKELEIEHFIDILMRQNNISNYIIVNEKELKTVNEIIDRYKLEETIVNEYFGEYILSNNSVDMGIIYKEWKGE